MFNEFPLALDKKYKSVKEKNKKRIKSKIYAIFNDLFIAFYSRKRRGGWIIRYWIGI